MKLATHLIPIHWGKRDEEQIHRIRPKSVKIIEHFRKGYIPTRTAQVHVLSPKSLLVLRDHPLSEQYDDVWKDPEATGKRHADDWAEKIQSWNWSIPDEQIVVLGINEFPAWVDPDPEKYGKPDAAGVFVNARYNSAFLRRLTQHGIRGGALNLNTGWPANWGTDMPPIWEPYMGLESDILEGDHFLFLHEYWPHQGPEKHWGWLAGRYQKCPMDVPIIMGECGLEERVVNSTLPPEKWGWQGWISAEEYMNQLDRYRIEITKDDRIHSAQVFTWDFSHPFGSTDVKPMVHLWKTNYTFDYMTNWKGTNNPPPQDSRLHDELLAAGELNQVIQFNPEAAIQKRIFSDGFVPNSSEFDVEIDGVVYRGQRAEHLGSGVVRVYYAKLGDWSNVKYEQR